MTGPLSDIQLSEVDTSSAELCGHFFYALRIQALPWESKHVGYTSNGWNQFRWSAVSHFLRIVAVCWKYKSYIRHHLRTWCSQSRWRRSASGPSSSTHQYRYVFTLVCYQHPSFPSRAKVIFNRHQPYFSQSSAVELCLSRRTSLQYRNWRQRQSSGFWTMLECDLWIIQEPCDLLWWLDVRVPEYSYRKIPNSPLSGGKRTNMVPPWPTFH